MGITKGILTAPRRSEASVCGAQESLGDGSVWQGADSSRVVPQATAASRVANTGCPRGCRCAYASVALIGPHHSKSQVPQPLATTWRPERGHKALSEASLQVQADFGTVGTLLPFWNGRDVKCMNPCSVRGLLLSLSQR